MESFVASACVLGIAVGAGLVWKAGMDRVVDDRRSRAFAAHLATVDAHVAALERASRMRQLGERDLPNPRDAANAIADLVALSADGRPVGAIEAVEEMRAILGDMTSIARTGFKNVLEWRKRRAKYAAVRGKLVEAVRRACGSHLPADFFDGTPSELRDAPTP